MSKKVRTLLRVSSKQQLYDDDIPVQRAQARQYIADRPDWKFDREYIEKAVSAYKNHVEERQVLQEILADARKHQFDVLLTYMSDRIGRQEEYSFYVATLNQLGIEVWTIRDGQLKTEEHIDKLLNYIRFWQNEGESKKTSMRVKDTQKELVKAGKFVGGKAPYGYCLVPSGMVSNRGRLLKKLEIVEENAKVVRKIYSLAVGQGMGYARIAKELNRQGILTPAADTWKAGTIRSILTNPVYMGYLAINRRVNHGSFVRLDRKDWIYSKEQIQELVIVSRQTWEKAQQIREARKAKLEISRERTKKEYELQYRVPFSTRGRLALTGIACCGYCGKPLKNASYCNHWTTKAGERKMAFRGRYACPENCTQRACYSQDYLERVVFTVAESYMEYFLSPELLREMQEIPLRQRKDLEKDLKAMQKEQKALLLDMRTLEGKLPEAIRGTYCFSAEKLSLMISEKERTYKELDEKVQLLKQRLSQEDEQTENKDKPAVAARDLKEAFQKADTAVKKMLLSSLVRTVAVKDGEIGISFRIRPVSGREASDAALLETDASPVQEQRL